MWLCCVVSRSLFGGWSWAGLLITIISPCISRNAHVQDDYFVITGSEGLSLVGDVFHSTHEA